MRKVYKEEADRLIAEFGSEAYAQAREAMREARHRRNNRLEHYFAQVAVRIAKDTGREIGVDTATRYLDG